MKNARGASVHLTMTSSDDLRGDQRSQKDRIDYSDLQEFQTLRALLRPRMDQVGASSTTEALRGLFVELEAANERAANIGLHGRQPVIVGAP